MSIIARGSKSEFTPAPEGLWLGVCCDVVYLGVQEYQWKDEEPKLLHKVEIRWQLEEIAGKPFIVSRQFTLSLHEKAKLRQVLESWRGKKFSPEELEGFDLEKLIGSTCQIQIVHNLGSRGGIFANVQAVVTKPKGAQNLLVDESYIRMKDRSLTASDETASDNDFPF